MALQFVREPFRGNPSPERFVAVSAHEAVVARLHQSVDGIILLEGEAGSGKTMIALKLLAECSTKHTPVYLPGCRFETPAALFQAILFDLDRKYENRTENELRLAVREVFLTMAVEGKPPILTLDDAQDLNAAVLDELRGIDNLPQACILLVASPGFRERLLEYPQILSRIAMSIRVGMLDDDSATEFIHKQISQNGGSEEAFSDEAISLIVAHGHGSPRQLNRLARLALVISRDAGEECVDVEAVLESIARLMPPAEPAHLPLTAEPRVGEGRNRGTLHDSATGRSPKTKARKRKAA